MGVAERMTRTRQRGDGTRMQDIEDREDSQMEEAGVHLEESGAGDGGAAGEPVPGMRCEASEGDVDPTDWGGGRNWW